MQRLGPAQLVEAFFENDVKAFTSGLASLRDRAADAPATRDAHFQELLSLLREIREACKRLEQRIGSDEPLTRAVQGRYREAIEPWFRQSRLMNHARVKPRGYAGDYQMLTYIYEAGPVGAGLGGLLDLYFLDTELGRAVPARKSALQDFLAAEFAARGPRVRVLDVACGPCREFQDGVAAPAGSDVSVTFVDYDDDALSFAEQALADDGSPYVFNFVRYNALRMQSPKRFIAEHGTFDVVYSVGLCDYLSDRQLIGIFKGWKQMLNPGGVMYVAFKDQHRYDKTDYQWLTDWFFLQREDADCRRLFLDAGFAARDLSMTRDDTGVIMCYAARAARVSRVHGPQQRLAGPAPVAIKSESPGLPR